MKNAGDVAKGEIIVVMLGSGPLRSSASRSGGKEETLKICDVAKFGPS